MKDYFHRHLQLWGQETQDLLRTKSVMIVGCGGLGNTIGLALGSAGLGRLYLVDYDTVSTDNIHRQIAFCVGDEGKNKADVLKELVEKRESGVEVHTVLDSIANVKDLKVDLIIDGSDNFEARMGIDAYAKSLNIPWIYGSVEEFHAQIAFFDKSKFDVFFTKAHSPKGITAPMVMQVGAFEANLALRYLAGLEVKKDLLYYMFFNNGEMFVSKFALPTGDDDVPNR